MKELHYMKICLGLKDLLQRCLIDMVVKLLLAVAGGLSASQGVSIEGLHVCTTRQLDFPRASSLRGSKMETDMFIT